MAVSASGDADGCNTLELPLSFHNASSGGSTSEGRTRLFLDDTRLTVTPIASPSVGSGGSAATVEHLRGLASAECHALPNDNQKVMVTTAADPDRHLILMVEARTGSNKGKFMAWTMCCITTELILLCADLFDAHTCVCFVGRGSSLPNYTRIITYLFSLEHRARPIRPFPVRRYQTRQGQNLPPPNDS